MEESGGLGEKTRKGKGDCSRAAPLPLGCLPKTPVDGSCVTHTVHSMESCTSPQDNGKTVLRKCRTQSIKDNIKEKGHKKASVSRCFFLIQIAASPAAPVEAVAVGSGQEAGEQGLCQWEQGIRGRVFRTDTEAPQLPGT